MLVVVVVVVVVMMLMVLGFLLASLVDSRALRNAVVVAFPDDVGVGREGKQSFDCFPDWVSIFFLHAH